MRDDDHAAGLSDSLRRDRESARRAPWAPPGGPEPGRPGRRVSPGTVAIAGALVALLVVAGVAVVALARAPRAHVPTAAAAPPSPTATAAAAPGDGSTAAGPPDAAASPSPSPTPTAGAPADAGLLAAGSPTTVPSAPGSTPAPTPTPGSTPTPAPDPLRFSFEDGGTDGWKGTGHVTSVSNGTTAYAGTRSLHATLFSASGSDLPYISVAVSGASAPGSGQTVSAFVFVASDTATIQAKVFVQDTRFVWHQSSLVRLPQERWTRLALTVPAGIAVNRVGVQFLASPLNAKDTIYLDAVDW